MRARKIVTDIEENFGHELLLTQSNPELRSDVLTQLIATLRFARRLHLHYGIADDSQSTGGHELHQLHHALYHLKCNVKTRVLSYVVTS